MIFWFRSGAAALTGAPVTTGKVLDLITAALQELGVVQGGGVPSGDDATLALGKLNRLLDLWNAKGCALYTSTLVTSFVTTPNLQPHTIGPATATFATAVRPDHLRGLKYLTNGVSIPIDVHSDIERWTARASKTTTSAAPIEAYYERDFPNGSLFFWPIVSAALPLEMILDTHFTQVQLTDDVWFPPGYQQALTLTLAELCAAPFKVQAADTTKEQARLARATIFDANDRVPAATTRDSGMPSGGRGGRFSYLTGRFI